MDVRVRQAGTHPPVAAKVRPRSEWKDDLVTAVLGTGMIVGAFVDGWSHLRADRTDSFLTPWHLGLYSGYAAVAAWILWQVRARRATLAGYGLGVAGVAVFSLGGAFDFAWHGIFGVEADVPSLFSPSHLVLALGIALLCAPPFAAAWADPSGEDAPGLSRFFPALLSLTLVMAIVSFFFMELTLFRDPFLNRSQAEWIETYRSHGMGPGFFVIQRIQDTEVRGLAALLVSGLMLTAPVLLCLRRWKIPFGSVTFLFGAIATAMTGLDGFQRWPLLLGALIAGVAGDVAVARLPFRLLAAALPVLVVGSYVATMALWHGLGWVPELWTGVLLYAAAEGWVLGLLMVPPPVPARSVAS
jgi:hypothetical protein